MDVAAWRSRTQESQASNSGVMINFVAACIVIHGLRNLNCLPAGKSLLIGGGWMFRHHWINEEGLGSHR
jgi:hypothetical protein